MKIDIVEAPYDSLYSKLVNTFKSSDSTYDLVMMDDPWMPKFGTDSSLSDLGALGIQKDSDVADVVWDVGTWPPPRGPVPPSEKDKKAQLLGVTIVGNVEMFMFRKDLTDPPASYDDVLANAKAQNKSDLAGYLIRGKATNPVVADFLPILWSFGGDVFDDNWNVVFDNDKSLAAVKFLVDDLKAVAQADPASTDAADRDRLMAIGQGYRVLDLAGRDRHRGPRRGLHGGWQGRLHSDPEGPERQGGRHDGQLDARRPEGVEEPAGRGRFHQVHAPGGHPEDLRSERRHPVTDERPQGLAR